MHISINLVSILFGSLSIVNFFNCNPVPSRSNQSQGSNLGIQNIWANLSRNHSIVPQSSYNHNYYDFYDYLEDLPESPESKSMSLSISQNVSLSLRADAADGASDPVLVQTFPDTYLKCSNVPEEEVKPLMCYQCLSKTGDRENGACDSELWEFTRRSERFQLRKRCPLSKGTYCIKKVQQKRGIRITERGCFGPGPVLAIDGSYVKLREGCVDHHQDGFAVKTCLCKSNDLCNFGISSSRHIPAWLITFSSIGLIILWVLGLDYYVT